MARGWESKSVEDQIAAAGEKTPAGRELTPEQRERESRKMTLGLSRARILQDLQAACNPRHRAMLERALADVEASLAQLS